MMDGQEFYRARLAECLALAEASGLPQVRDRHLSAARSWQALLTAEMERKADVSALQREARRIASREDDDMSDTGFEIPEAVVDAIVDDSTPAQKAFREDAGVSVPGLAEATDIPTQRLDAIENGGVATEEELARIGDALGVPADLLRDE